MPEEATFIFSVKAKNDAHVILSPKIGERHKVYLIGESVLPPFIVNNSI